MQNIQQILKDGDSFAVLEHIQRHGTPLEVAARYQSLLSDLYWKAHDLAALLVVGQAGIAFCLTQSLLPGTSADSIDKLRSAAKSLAYDVGSFTWPGWQEPGIHPTPHQISMGRDCALLNLRLAIELNKPPERLSMAHWLVGAHALSAGDFPSAEHEFKRAQDVLPLADPAAEKLKPCNLGYQAIAQRAQNPANSAAKEKLASILNSLKSRTDHEAQTFLSQLTSARQLFVSAAQT